MYTIQVKIIIKFYNEWDIKLALPLINWSVILTKISINVNLLLYYVLL